MGVRGCRATLVTATASQGDDTKWAMTHMGTLVSTRLASRHCAPLVDARTENNANPTRGRAHRSINYSESNFASKKLPPLRLSQKKKKTKIINKKHAFERESETCVMRVVRNRRRYYTALCKHPVRYLHHFVIYEVACVPRLRHRWRTVRQTTRCLKGNIRTIAIHFNNNERSVFI